MSQKYDSVPNTAVLFLFRLTDGYLLFIQSAELSSETAARRM